MATTIWYNHGYSQTRDALLLLRAAEGSAVRLLASHADPLAPALTVADIAIVEPAIDRAAPGGAAAYAEWCLATARAHRVDLFVPQRGRTAVAARAADFAAAGIRLALAADAATLPVLDDKGRFAAAARAHGLPVPETFAIDDLAGFDHAVATLRAAGHAACVKPPQGVFGAGFWLLDDDAPLFDQLMDPDARRIATRVVREAVAAAPGRKLLVMQHLPGPEWSVDLVADRGRLVAGVVRRKFETTQLLETGGPILAIAAATAAAFNLSNLVNIQLKAAGPGDADPRLLEVNPRMSGGCRQAALAGLNLPWLQMRLALGRPVPPQPSLALPLRVAAVSDAIILDPPASELAPGFADAA